MRRVVSLSLAAVLAAVSVSAVAAVRPQVSELVFRSSEFDGQQVEVRGKASQIQSKTSKAGREYVLFRLTDEKNKWVKVFAWGAPVLYEGRSVTVIGTFRAEKKVGDLVFKKEIEADEIR